MKLRLKELRKTKTMKEQARLLNIPEKTYANYENGITEPNLDTLCKLSDYFNVSLNYLCDHPYNNQVGHIPEDKVSLVKLVLELNSSDAKEIYQYIKGYTNAKKQ